MQRRDFLKTCAATVGGVALAGPLQAFAAGGAAALDADPSALGSGGYGPLAPVADSTTGHELLALPDGFRYWSFDAVGTPMSDGVTPVPAAHDGTGCFGGPFGRSRLVRNHEIGSGTPFVPPEFVYDPGAGGGNTIVEFDARDPQHPRSFPVLSGTIRNCAGGETPWGSWLTCEETTVDNGGIPHGYVFEVPSRDGPVPAVPYKRMGRFAHEALAVDPLTSVVYLTEDAGGTSGFYRYLPRRWGRLGDGGTLQMLAVKGVPNYTAFTDQVVGNRLPVEWVTIDQPDPPGNNPTTFSQGAAKGGAAFRRLEGTWWSTFERRLYFNSTDGGNALAGQVWRYDPGFFGSTLELVYESPGSDVLLKPDNITVSPRRGVLLCEDTDRARQTFLRGLNREGALYDFAANIRPGTIPTTSTPMSWDEFAGACFSLDGRWLFVHIQSPGLSFAITGPWSRGPL